MIYSVADNARKAGQARMALLDSTQRKALASLGGVALSRKLSATQRSRSARKAAKARWEKCKVVSNSDIRANVPASTDVDVNEPI